MTKKTTQKQQWSYLVRSYSSLLKLNDRPLSVDDEGIQKTLNELGELGWELIGYNWGDGYLFKRPKQPRDR